MSVLAINMPIYNNNNKLTLFKLYSVKSLLWMRVDVVSNSGIMVDIGTD